MDFSSKLHFLLSLSYLIICVDSVELLFELPDNARQCFFQDMKKNVTTTFEYDTISGGQFDISVTIKSPTEEVIYKTEQIQSDSHTFTTKLDGVYEACFSNEFSYFSHKIVYMNFQVGEELTLTSLIEHDNAMTQLESSAQLIHQNLNKVLEFQTHHLLKEARGRKQAEDIHERVTWWSVTETIAILIISIGQVFILKKLLTDRKSPY